MDNAPHEQAESTNALPALVWMLAVLWFVATGAYIVLHRWPIVLGLGAAAVVLGVAFGTTRRDGLPEWVAIFGIRIFSIGVVASTIALTHLIAFP